MKNFRKYHLKTIFSLNASKFSKNWTNFWHFLYFSNYSLVGDDKIGTDVDSKAQPDLASRKCLFPADEAEVGVPQTKIDQQPPGDHDDDSLYDVDLSRFGHLDNNFSAAYQLFSKISCPGRRFRKMYYPWLPESRRINKLAPLLLCWIPVHIYTSSVRKKNFRILFEWSRNHPSSSPVWDNEASEERPEKSLCIPLPEAISGVLKVDSRAMTFNISSNIFLEQFPWSDCSSKIKILTKNPYIGIF